MVLLSWLSTLKFILFACSYKGALSSNPPLSFPHFLLIASFLIKCQHKLVSKLSNHTNNQNHNQIKVTSLNWSNKLLVIFIHSFFFFYSSKQKFRPIIFMSLYILQVYTGLEIFLASITVIICKLVQVELEQPFNKPHLSTLVQDFYNL
jgi:hypothetical protein